MSGTAAELRVGWHGAGPVRASGWWIYPDGSTSAHLCAVRPTREEACAEVRRMARDQQADVAAPSSSP